MLTKPRVILIHSEVRTYRVPVFSYLNKVWDITFLFCSPGKLLPKSYPELKWKYKYFNNYKLPFYSADVTPGIFWYLLTNSNSYDAVIFSGIYSFSTHFCFYLTKLLNKKVILWDETWVIPKTISSKLLVPFICGLVKSASACIAAGTKAKELYIKLGANPRGVFIAPNSTPDISADIDHNLTKELRAKWQIPLNSTVISYMGRVVEYKNLDCLINAFALIRKDHPNAVLFIAGDGPYADTCEQLINKLGWERIIWAKGSGNKLEPINHNEFIHFYDFTDVFVLPGRFILTESVPCEAWGLTLNEAMSLGKAVIASKSVAAGFDLIKSGENGYLVEPDNANDLAQALSKTLSVLDFLSACKTSQSLIQNGFNATIMGKGFEAALEYTCSPKTQKTAK